MVFLWFAEGVGAILSLEILFMFVVGISFYLWAFLGQRRSLLSVKNALIHYLFNI
jgi:hypothetical protein